MHTCVYTQIEMPLGKYLHVHRDMPEKYMHIAIAYRHVTIICADTGVPATLEVGGGQSGR